MNFERGGDPKKAMNIGKDRIPMKGDSFKAYDRRNDKIVDIIALEDAISRTAQFFRRPDHYYHIVNIKFANEPIGYAIKFENDNQWELNRERAF